VKPAFLDTPAAWLRTQRESFDRATYACAIQRVTDAEIEAAHRDCNWAIWFLAGVFCALAFVGYIA
jgi:hypothetical protein